MSARLLFEMFFGKSPITADGYQVVSVASKFESKRKARMPIEFEILFSQDPIYRQEVEKLLDLGYVIEIHRLAHVPGDIRRAVRSIAYVSQEGTFGLWLSRLLIEGDRPTFTEREIEGAKRQGISLYDEVEHIFAQRYAYKRILLKDPQQVGIDAFQQDFFSQLNERLSSHALEYGKKRILAESTSLRTDSWRRLLFLFVCAGAVVQLVGGWMGALAYLSALVIGGVYEEGVELWALQRAGYAGRPLVRRGALLALFFAIACVAAWVIQDIVARGDFALGGFMFGVAASILPVMLFLRAISDLRQRFSSLQQAGKLRASERVGWSVIWQEYVLHPAKMAALVGVCLMPMASLLLFRAFPMLAHNGWMLVFLVFLELFVLKIGVAVFSAWPLVYGGGGKRFFA